MNVAHLVWESNRSSGWSGLPRLVVADILVPVVGGLGVAQARNLVRAGLRAFVVSGNLGEPDGRARYNLPPAEIERLVAGFIAQVSNT